MFYPNLVVRGMGGGYKPGRKYEVDALIFSIKVPEEETTSIVIWSRAVVVIVVCEGG